MADKALLRNSSLFVAYMGCLGWGSAYFYGWGGAFYYGFPWWVVGAGVDDVARSLFYAVTAIVIFLVGWIIGVIFFFSVKQKNDIRDLSYIRTFFAILLLFIPPVAEFSIIRKQLVINLLLFSVVIALVVSFLIRMCWYYFPVKCIFKAPFIRHHGVEILMFGFMAYFWSVSLFAGWYKPQFKKEYQMLYYENAWYYVLARYDKRLVLSESFNVDDRKFIILNSDKIDRLEINILSP
ncbi:hypothetical protein [Escherichia coli]|uniref:hypothetical protein n=1 Tax=Escherichia coli TaxID=562 RepID=UPI000BE17922|nr:hypothetical protein [Escherichia coli]